MKKRFWIVLAALVVLVCVFAAAGCAQPDPVGTTQTRSACEKQGHAWQEATCTQAKTCKVCAVTEGEALGHTWQSATCTEPKSCETCAATEGEAMGHDWQEATCTVPKSCAACAVTEGEVLGHTWKEATCTAAKACEVCATTEGEALGHTWLDATCTQPKTCEVCGETEGDITDHQWKKASCSKPGTCVICGKTSGSALGHNWKDATCTTAKRCSTCGAVSGDPLGHDFEESTDGKTKLCKTCGETVTIKYIAITFDDGPSGNITKTLLEGLEKRGAKATFFICGYRIRSFKSYPQLILDYGHEIGLHTDNHANLTKLDEDGICRELEGMMHLLPEDCQVRLMRPPGGAYNAKVKQVCLDMGLSIIMWSVDPKDWATNDVDTIVQRIVNGASHGGIVLMHDLKSSSVTAALKAISLLQAQGYEFVTVTELAQIMGKTLEPGQVYYSLK